MLLFPPEEYMLPFALSKRESGCSRQGTCPFPLVFGFRKAISAGCLLMDLLCEGWLWHVLCVVYNFSRLCLFCTMSSSGLKQRSTREHGRLV